MIGYVTLGSNDILRAGAFYDAVLGEIGGNTTNGLRELHRLVDNPGNSDVGSHQTV